MSEAVSVCVPTYERPGLLHATIESCFAQSHRPLQIIVGDDSRSQESRDMIASLATPDGVAIEYLPRGNAASQRDNIIRLFNRAKTTYVSLLHDDDLFAPGGLDAAVRAAYEHPHAIGSFGSQEVIDADGAILPNLTEEWNRRYFRTPEYLDKSHSLWFSALTLQLPSNGYVLKTHAARAAAATMPTNPGSAVDVAFALRLAEANAESSIFVCSDVTHQYRLTPGAETERLDHLPIFEFSRGITVPEAYKCLHRKRLGIFLVAAVNERLSRGDIETARKLIFSGDYPAAQRWRPMGIFHNLAASLRLPRGVVRLPYAISRKRRFAHRNSVEA